MQATQILAEYSSGLKYEDLPSATVRMAKQCILDWMGVAIRGSQEKPAQILQQTILSADRGTEASVLGGARRCASAMNAAFLNGAASHALDFDDLHNSSIVHVSAIVIPPAIAVSEANHKSGRDTIAAVAAGYEIAARVGESVVPESYYFWHTTGTAGTIAAGAAAARALGLDAEQTVHALGSAGTQAAGLWEFVKEGAMSKVLHAGKACYGGVLSAYLARLGFTGATRILEGEKGFCRAMAKEPHFGKLTEDIGGRFKIDENSFKPYPCCKGTHAAIYATLVLREKYGFCANDVHHVDILVSDVIDSIVNNPAPRTPYGCKFSIQHCVACALRYGKVGLEQFTSSIMEDAAVRSLIEKISVKQDKELQAIYDADSSKIASKVVVELESGDVVEETVEYPKGDPANPMTWEDSRDKFCDLVIPVLGDDRAQQLVNLVDGLEKVDDLAVSLNKILS